MCKRQDLLNRPRAFVLRKLPPVGLWYVTSLVNLLCATALFVIGTELV